MTPSPRMTPRQAPDTSDVARSTISRRTLAKGAAWAAPAVLVAAAAPAYAASYRDIVVGKTSCGDAGGTNNSIPFTVTTSGGATLPAGSEFVVNYAGGSNTPTWSGALAANSTAVLTPSNDTSTNGGRYGTIRFTLKNPMPANTTWALTIVMDIGALITGQETRLTYTPSGDPWNNRETPNDTASHEMYFGGCRN